MIDLINIAHVGSTQGKLGALKVYPKEQFEQALLDAEFVFFQINGSKVPFEVDKINTSHDPFLLYLKDIAKPELASNLSNSEIYLESKFLGDAVSVVDKGMNGFEVFSSENQSFGIVSKVEEHPQQILLVVEGENGEFRIPFHPDLVDHLDQEERKLIYTYSSEDFSMLV